MKLLKTAFFVLAIFFTAGVILPLMIKGFFLGLLYFLNNPFVGLAISSAFLLGMFVATKADSWDKAIDNL